jgi:hypothetical protein
VQKWVCLQFYWKYLLSEVDSDPASNASSNGAHDNGTTAANPRKRPTAKNPESIITQVSKDTPPQPGSVFVSGRNDPTSKLFQKISL